MFFKTLCVAAAVICIFKVVQRWWLYRRLQKYFQIPPTHPFTGCLMYFPRDVSDVFQHILSYFKYYGKNTVIVGLFYEIVLYVSKPDDVETVLAKSNPKLMKKATDYDYLNPWLGTGLLTGYGEKWFQRRKIVAPSFHLNILEEFTDVFAKQSDVFIQKLESYIDKGDFDVYYPVRLFALDVICETAMGIEMNIQLEPESDYANAVKDMTELMHKNFFSIIRRISVLYFFTKQGRKERQLIKTMHAFTENVINKRREILINEMKNDSTSFPTRRNMNLLDILLQTKVEGKSLSNEDIREEVDTFMFAGHDTSTSALVFMIYLLGKNPSSQDKLYRELHDHFKDNKSPKLTYNDLNDLKYLDMVVKESLRLYPPVPFIGRHLMEDVTIDNTMIPNDTNVILGIYPMHHDAEYFPYPEKFRPERFDPDVSQTWPKSAYMPFSIGPRNCIGQRFAILEMKCVLVKLLLNYEVKEAQHNSDVVLQADITLKSSNGVHIQINKRNN